MSTDTQGLLIELRKLAIVSLFADDHFLDIFVLKGGNALNIAYDVNDRASMDLDFSMRQDLGMDVETAKEKLSNSLERTYGEYGYKVFDVKLYPTPGQVREQYKTFWGGYTLEFKVITTELFDSLDGDLQAAQKNAIVVDENQKKKMKIDISKFEYTDSKTEVELDGYTIYVYTPLMVVYEKLRALCQQIEDYSEIVSTNRKSRPRDVFDIYTTLKKFPEMRPLEKDNLNILIEMFKIKRVPLYFLEKIEEDRDFHGENFQSVIETVSSEVEIKSFDYYFDELLKIIDDLVRVLKDSNLYDKEDESLSEKSN